MRLYLYPAVCLLLLTFAACSSTDEGDDESDTTDESAPGGGGSEPDNDGTGGSDDGGTGGSDDGGTGGMAESGFDELNTANCEAQDFGEFLGSCDVSDPVNGGAFCESWYGDGVNGSEGTCSTNKSAVDTPCPATDTVGVARLGCCRVGTEFVSFESCTYGVQDFQAQTSEACVNNGGCWLPD